MIQMGNDKFLPSLHTVLLLVRESIFHKLPHLPLLASHSLSWRMCGSCCPVFCREAQYSCWILSPWTRLLSIPCLSVGPQQEKNTSKIYHENGLKYLEYCWFSLQLLCTVIQMLRGTEWLRLQGRMHEFHTYSLRQQSKEWSCCLLLSFLSLPISLSHSFNFLLRLSAW